MADIDNSQDTLDVRDIIERFEELETASSEETLTGDERQELSTLQTLLDDLKGNGGDEQWRGDWYPVALIRDSYFKKAMDELLEDIGELPKELPPYLSITVDYKALQMDYSSAEFDGVTYWYR